MRIKLDENLSSRLKAVLTGLGHDADTVRDERLTGRPDRDVWAAAQADRRFLITLDGDFGDGAFTRPARTLAFSLRACRTLNNIAPRNMFWGGSSGSTPPSGLAAWSSGRPRGCGFDGHSHACIPRAGARCSQGRRC